jgi:hypothetical protein
VRCPRPHQDDVPMPENKEEGGGSDSSIIAEGGPGEGCTHKGGVEIWDQSPTKDRRVRFAVDEEVRELTAEPTKQDQRAPINMVGGRAWSPGIYRSLRLLGKSLDVAWERAFIHPLTFN